MPDEIAVTRPADDVGEVVADVTAELELRRALARKPPVLQCALGQAQ